MKDNSNQRHNKLEESYRNSVWVFHNDVLGLFKSFLCTIQHKNKKPQLMAATRERERFREVAAAVRVGGWAATVMAHSWGADFGTAGSRLVFCE